ncbi:hypothetical protein Mal15_09030 [Stieleria maiorica]|uniref:Uncharacterized protein n=1 Tax=Stieleria maiorica TaxID=2795974 RepID=A0A5B9M875_9BACT|nr:hypothetical protein [Stieleria maiorica]QEF96873.1 hypothetical protein Mal15_09030 [Stieleria maiorica]
MNHPERSLPRLLAIAALIAFPGCGGTDSADRPAAASSQDTYTISLPETPAAEYLRQVLTRYQNTRAYRDRGQVRLDIEKNGKRVRRTAPMHVVMDGPTIWIAAYDARIWSDSDRMIGWIADPQTDFHDSQVVLGPPAAGGRSASRPGLETLLRDPILTSRMVSGLGGPPPQLEWLLDPNPMGKLFGTESDAPPSSDTPEERSIRYDGLARRENVQCVIVQATAGEDVYRFWIDPTRSLIHGVELPVSMAGKQIELEGWKVHALELVLADATFQSPASPYQITDMPDAELPPQPKYLRAMVPLPPPPPDRRLGRTLPTLQATDRTGRITVNQRGIDRPLTLWYAGVDPSVGDAQVRNVHAAEILSAWIRQSPESIRESVRPVALVDDSTARLFTDAGLANGFWVLLDQRGNRDTRGLELEAGRAMLVDSSGKVVWIGDPFSAADIISLAAIAGDVIAGVDVSDQIHRQWKADHDAYRQRVAELQTP